MNSRESLIGSTTMHPQRTLIEAAMLVQEIALATPEDNPQAYDKKHHSHAALLEILKLNRPSPDDGKEAIMKFHSQVKSVMEQHHPLDHHAEEAASALAGHYKSYSSIGKPVPDHEIINVMGNHYSNYHSGIVKHHSARYSKFVSGHEPTVNKHKDQFSDSVSEILEGFHGLMITGNGIEPIR